MLALEEVPTPEPAAGEVLVEVRAASVNALDWHLLRGKPYLARLSEGVRRPQRAARGVDVAGVVAKVGAGVDHLSVGDRVVGCRTGAFGEFVAGSTFVAVPPGIGFDHAAALPTAGITALQGLRDRADVQPGDRVLVYGAGGGVGTFAVQIARSYGAAVTVATRPGSIATLEALGPDRVVDYTVEDPLATTYDVVFDAGGTRSLRDLRRATVPGGRVVLAAPAPGDWLAPVWRMLRAATTGRSSRPVRAFVTRETTDDLVSLLTLVEQGAVRPVIDSIVDFDQVPDAIRRLEAGGVVGKVVVRRLKGLDSGTGE